MCNRGFGKALVLEPQHWPGWLMGMRILFGDLLLLSHPYPSSKNFLGEVKRTDTWGYPGASRNGWCVLLLGTTAIWTFCHWWWNAAKSLCIPHRGWSSVWLCLLAFEAVVAASPYCFSVLVEYFRCTPITLHMVPYFCSALSSSPLWIKHPFWSCRYVGCFQVEILFSENSIPQVALPQDIL